jgi:hypothetical protein
MTRRTLGQRLDQALSCGWLCRATACGALIAVGLLAGTLIPPPVAVWGQERVMPTPPAFKSGDQLALPVLQDIAATLHQIDDRMARLEVVFKELTKPRPGTSSRN